MLITIDTDKIPPEESYEEYKQHTENGRLSCICTRCNQTYGYNLYRKQLLEILEN